MPEELYFNQLSVKEATTILEMWKLLSACLLWATYRFRPT